MFWRRKGQQDFNLITGATFVIHDELEQEEVQEEVMVVVPSEDEEWARILAEGA